MRCALTFALLGLVSISIAASSQTPARIAASGSIEGAVVRSDTGAPVVGAQVSLRLQVLQNVGTLPTGEARTPRPTSRSVVTGTDGKFSFKDVAAGGYYRLEAVAEGFVRQEAGTRVLNGQGRPIFMTAGLAVKDISIRLFGNGAVAGRVLDENGQPATGAPVQLVRAIYNVAQGRTLRPVATIAVNDRGEYRAFGVPPGRYYLIAGTPPSGNPQRGSGPGPGRGGTARFSLLYYPNGESLDQAQTIEVKSGGETRIDMLLRRQVQSYRARGRVVDGSGAGLPATLSITLVCRFLTGGCSKGGAMPYNAGTGTFELQDVPPGDWTVVASAPVPSAGQVDPAARAAREVQFAARLFGAVPIKVFNRDVEGLVITLRTGVSVGGRVRVEGQSILAIPSLAGMRLNVQPLEPTGSQPAPAVLPVSPDGSFQVAGLREAEYRIQFPAVVGSGLYLKSITYGGEDVLNKPLRFSGSGSGVFDVVFGSGAVQVTGTLTDATSQPVPGNIVFLIPAQPTRQDLFRTTSTDQRGRFTLSDVPPGEYKLFSWESIDMQTIMDPDVLKHYEQQRKTLQVVAGSNSNVDVKLIPAQ